MRRRSPPAASTEPMEKGNGKNQRNRICLLACLSVFFWTLLLYFHFVILGSNNDTYEHVKLQPSYAQTEPSISLRVPKISPAPLHDTSSSDPPPVHDTSSSKPAPVHDTSSSKPPAVHDTSSSKPPPVHNSSSSNPPHVSLPKFPSAPLSDAHSTKNPRPALTNTTKPVQEQSKVSGSNVSTKNEFPFTKALRTRENKSDPCGGRYIYVHDLPSRFNEDMLKECRSLSLWTNMCKFTTNAGLGPPLENLEGVFSDTGWYATNQFAVDVIFTNRMKQYECLTNDSSLAAAIFVPFYAGFDIARYLWGYNISRRDAASLDLVDWLMKRPEWGIMSGKDHFLVAGRITWDFRRLSEEESDWGNKLLFLPAAKNMSMLVVESSPWNANDFGIPYPTYFHPAKDSDVFNWQERMRNLDRKWLFSFAGAPRPDNPKSIRGQIIDQCRKSKVGKLLECDFGESKCHSPSSIMQMFQSSLFCLQPQGDSYTRRSAFDSMLAGCIPVFFHPGSAYTQYTWHLPKNYSTYSVFIPEDDIRKRNMSIEDILTRIPPQQVKIMRENVINLIPGLIYADPRSKLETLKDAFDVAVQAVIDKVTRLRKNMIEGRTEYDNFVEENSWKYALLDEGQREVGGHIWDPFFSKPKKEGENDNGAAASSSLSAEAAKNSWKSEQRDNKS